MSALRYLSWPKKKVLNSGKTWVASTYGAAKYGLFVGFPALFLAEQCSSWDIRYFAGEIYEMLLGLDDLAQNHPFITLTAIGTFGALRWRRKIEKLKKEEERLENLVRPYEEELETLRPLIAQNRELVDLVREYKSLTQTLKGINNDYSEQVSKED